jgi:hypothetical protein
MIISIVAENAWDKMQNPFMIEVPKKLGVEGTYFNIIKVTYTKPMANIIINGRKTESIYCKVRNETRIPTLSTLIYYLFASTGA